MSTTPSPPPPSPLWEKDFVSTMGWDGERGPAEEGPAVLMADDGCVCFMAWAWAGAGAGVWVWVWGQSRDSATSLEATDTVI